MQRISASFLPPIALDPRSGTPLYHQLTEWFRRAIIGGQLRPGQRVPSTRNLASELKISRIPVLSAYEQLFAEGYLETFTGAGTCVARSIPDEAPEPERVKARSTPPRPTGAKLKRDISRRAAAVREVEQSWLNNLGALPGRRAGPGSVPHQRLVEAREPAFSETTHSLLAYGDPMGYLPLREAIAEYLGAFRAVRCEASQVLVTTGRSRAYNSPPRFCWTPGTGCGWKSPAI